MCERLSTNLSISIGLPVITHLFFHSLFPKLYLSQTLSTPTHVANSMLSVYTSRRTFDDYTHFIQRLEQRKMPLSDSYTLLPSLAHVCSQCTCRSTSLHLFIQRLEQREMHLSYLYTPLPSLAHACSQFT